MPIPVLCPTCQVKLKAPDNLAGQAIKCPRCQTVIRVPAAEPVPVQSAPAPKTEKVAASALAPERGAADDFESNLKDAPGVRTRAPSAKEVEDFESNLKDAPGVNRRSRKRDWDDDDEDDRPARRPARRQRDEDDEDEDDHPARRSNRRQLDQDDDEENIKPAPRSKRRSDDDEDDDGRPAKRARRADPDEDDDEDAPRSCKLPEDLRSRVENELEDGEKRIWVGQPAPELVFKRSLLRAGVMLFFGLVSVVMVFVMFAAELKKGNAAMVVLSLPIPLGIMAAGIALPFYQKWRASRTCYLLTNERAIVFQPNVFCIMQTTRYSPRELRAMRWNNSFWDKTAGDVVFKTVTVITTTHYRDRRGHYAGSRTSATTYYYGFLAVRDPQAVHRLISRTLLEGDDDD
jgi:hypothetical protein